VLALFRATVPWSAFERSFYAANREEIKEELLPEETFANLMEDFPIETCLRRISAVLHVERSGRAKLEERVRLMEENTLGKDVSNEMV